MADAKQQNGATTGSSVQPSDPGDAPPAETLRQVAEDVRAAFPGPLSAPELVLIDVDPSRVHAFWNLSPATFDRVRQGLGREGDDAPMVLRFHQLSASGATTAPFDVEVVGAQGRCYIDIWDEGRLYRGELGLRRSDGSLVPLAASADVELPRAGAAETGVPVNPAALSAMAQRVQEQVSPMQPDEPVRHPFPLPPSEPSEYVADLGPPNTAAGVVMRSQETWRGGPPMSEPAPTVSRPDTLAPTSEELPEPVRHPFPLPPMQASEFDPGTLIGGFLPPTEDRRAADDELAAEISLADEAGPEAPSFGGTQTSGLPEGQEPAEAGMQPSEPLPLENVLTLSSYALGRETVEFEVNAELHVFGRARPGTRLELFGRKVPLRPDGSFSITRPLPNGALVLSSLLVGDDNQQPGEQ